MEGKGGWKAQKNNPQVIKGIGGHIGRGMEQGQQRAQHSQTQQS